MTDKAASSYSGWCRKRNHTTGEMQLVRKHSETTSKSKRQRLEDIVQTDPHPKAHLLAAEHPLIPLGATFPY